MLKFCVHKTSLFVISFCFSVVELSPYLLGPFTSYFVHCAAITVLVKTNAKICEYFILLYLMVFIIKSFGDKISSTNSQSAEIHNLGDRGNFGKAELTESLLLERI